MNPLAPAFPLPKPETLETPETPQVPQHVYDLLEQAANMVGKSGLAQEEQGQITKALAPGPGRRVRPHHVARACPQGAHTRHRRAEEERQVLLPLDLEPRPRVQEQYRGPERAAA